MMRYDSIRIDPAYSDALRECDLLSTDAVLTRLGARIVAWSRTTDTVYVPGCRDRPGFFVKRYFYTRWRNRLRGSFRGTLLGKHRGFAEFAALRNMRQLGISTVRPVAYGSRRVGAFVAACFLVTEEVPDARNLTSIAREVVEGRLHLTFGLRRRIVRKLAEQVAEMHNENFYHGQLFWRNILLRLGADREPEFFFLDARPPGRMSRTCARQDCRTHELAQLLASATPFTARSERLSFMEAYAACIGMETMDKSWLAAIAAAAERFRKHEMRRIRMNDLFDVWNEQLQGNGNGERRPGAVTQEAIR
jgi:tRNA A-37 threonylcarbamoyl transferase component Bud32